MLSRRLYVAIGILSASIIAFQLALMQNLSFVQWSHFAYMVISVALLGFGASGTLLSLFRSFFLRHYTSILPLLFALCAASMAMVMHLTQRTIPGFDPFMIFSSSREAGALILVYLIYLLPFLFGGAALGLVYSKFSSSIGGLYFADLSGAASGGILLTVLLWMLPPWQLMPLLAILPLAGAFLVFDYKHNVRYITILAICAAVSGYFILKKDYPTISQYKSLSKALSMQGSTVILQKSSPYGQLHVVSSPIMRFAPGLSPCANRQPPKATMLFSNGGWFGAIPQGSTSERCQFYSSTLYALPFAAGAPAKVLMLDAGTAPFAYYCLTKHTSSITMVEQNGLVLDALRSTLAPMHDSLLYNPQVRTVENSSRSYLQSDTSTYDLIVYPDIGSFGGSSGVMAAGEQYLLTTEAFGSTWNRLSRNGYLMIPVWIDYPTRATLKTLSTITDVLSSHKIASPEAHIVMARSWSNAVFLLKKSPFTHQEIDSIRRFCLSQCFDPVIPSSIRPKEGSFFNILQDENADSYVDSLLFGNPHRFQASYPFEVRPATDNQPYFYRFFKPSRFSELRKQHSFTSLAYMETGYFFIFITLFQILGAVLLLIILPMLFLKVRGKGIRFTLFYFSGLGIGFMFVEIVLIQQLILFLGQPMYAASAVISLLLLFSGIGSFFTERFSLKRSTMQKVLFSVILLIGVYAFSLGYILVGTVFLPMPGKVILSMLLIAPLAFFMGMAFPLGIRHLSNCNPSLVPWAWGINSSTSVVSTVLATIIALHVGFKAVMVVAAAAYLISLLAVILRKD